MDGAWHSGLGALGLPTYKGRRTLSWAVAHRPGCAQRGLGAGGKSTEAKAGIHPSAQVGGPASA